jgi:hypothetical protein
VSALNRYGKPSWNALAPRDRYQYILLADTQHLPPATMGTTDYLTPVAIPQDIRAKREGTLDAVVVWYDLTLSDGIVVSNDPLQGSHSLAMPEAVQFYPAGGKLEVKVRQIERVIFLGRWISLYIPQGGFLKPFTFNIGIIMSSAWRSTTDNYSIRLVAIPLLHGGPVHG